MFQKLYVKDKPYRIVVNAMRDALKDGFDNPLSARNILRPHDRVLIAAEVKKLKTPPRKV